MRPVRRLGASVGLILALAALPLGGCGENKAQRGLAPASESDAPTSNKADQESSAQRQQQVDQDMQKQQQKEFDQSNQGGKPAQ